MSSFRRGACALALSALSLGFGCNQKRTAAPPPNGMPPLDQPGAADRDHPVHAPTTAAEGLPTGHPPLDAPSNGFSGTTPGGAFDKTTMLSGVLELDPKVKDKVKAGDVIFLVARKADPNGAPGMPLAVKKLTVQSFPLPFSLDSRDAMIAGTELRGSVVVTARVDKDGDAITKTPGDVTGTTKPVVPPQEKLVLSLDKVL